MAKQTKASKKFQKRSSKPDFQHKKKKIVFKKDKDRRENAATEPEGGPALRPEITCFHVITRPLRYGMQRLFHNAINLMKIHQGQQLHG